MLCALRHEVIKHHLMLCWICSGCARPVCLCVLKEAWLWRVL